MDNADYSNHKNFLLSSFIIAGDVLICILSYMLFYHIGGYDFDKLAMQKMIMIGAIYCSIVISGGVILYKRNIRDFQIMLIVIRNVVVYAIIATLLLYLGDFFILPPLLCAGYCLLMAIASTAFRLSIRYAIKKYCNMKDHRRNVVLVGSTPNNVALYKELVEVPCRGYKVEGYFDYEENKNFSQSCKYLGSPTEVIDYLRKHDDIHELYCCLPSKDQELILSIIHYCVNNLVHFYSVPNVSNYLRQRMFFNMMGNVPYLSLYRDPLTKVENRFVKRTFDIIFSGIFLCTLFPFIFIIVAIITKVTMPGPIFFTQKRSGINGKEFTCYKFRSMRVNDDADKVQATKDDPRKTKWGDIMRRTNIDEFPQFINVFIGDMSIVGPRPHMLKHTEEYSKLIDKYMVRHFVKPGITGWSQVTGFRGETKELYQMEGRIQGDIWYIEHWSLWLDIFIIYKTVANAIKGEKEAY